MKVTACLVTAPALPVSLCVPRVEIQSRSVARAEALRILSGLCSPSRLGCPGVLAGEMTRGTGWWPRFPEDRQCGLQQAADL